MSKLLVLFGFLSLCQATLADCPTETQRSGLIQIERGWNVERNVCQLSVKPRNTNINPQYRSYSFDSSGLFMVFNSYGRGPVKTTTGFREFFVLPILSYEPTYTIKNNGDVVIKMVSNHELTISNRDFSIISLNPGEFLEKALAKDNEGGVEIALKEGFWFDSGFKMGIRPLSYPLATSLLKSAKSPPFVVCRLVNQNFLSYKDSNYIIAYQSDELVDFLSRSCGQLRF